MPTLPKPRRNEVGQTRQRRPIIGESRTEEIEETFGSTGGSAPMVELEEDFEIEQQVERRRDQQHPARLPRPPNEPDSQDRIQGIDWRKRHGIGCPLGLAVGEPPVSVGELFSLGILIDL
jgi:hypothetical protein